MLPKTIVKLRKLKYLHAGKMGIVGQQSIAERILWLCRACCVPLFLGGFNMRDACNYNCCIQPRVLMMDLDNDVPMLPRGSRKLKGLHTLRHVHLAWGNTVIQEIERLTQLRKLGVVGINKKNGPSFYSAISKLSQLESLSVCADWYQGLRGCLDHGTSSSSSTSSPPENLQSLKLQDELGKLPQWIGKLQNLVKLRLWLTQLEDADAAIEVLGALPSLAILRLWNNSFNYDVVCLNFRQEQQEATAVVLFPSLRVLEVSRICSDRLESVQFGGGATPKLELLQFSHFAVSCGVGFLSGLEELENLREFTMLSDFLYDYDFVKDVEEQLANHPNPNKPLLRFSLYI